MNWPKKSIFILIDPENESDELVRLKKWQLIDQNPSVSGIFLGGSTLHSDYSSAIISEFKRQSNKPIIGFPGGADQIFEGLNHVLFLNYLNNDTAKFTRKLPLEATQEICRLNLSCSPTAYIIVNQQDSSTSLQVTQSVAFRPNQWNTIKNRIKLSQYFGQTHLYLEAGSGSKQPNDPILISKIRAISSQYLIVGGGIQTNKEIKANFIAGANAVVIGSAVEKDPELIKHLSL